MPISFRKPTVSFCVVLELPFGWEEVSDKVNGKYYIDHNGREYEKNNVT